MIPLVGNKLGMKIQVAFFFSKKLFLLLETDRYI